jgi:hypothetical protein
LEEKRSRYKSPGWLCAKERIGHLVRDNYRVDQEMSPRLAAFVKKIEDRSAEIPAEMLQAPSTKQGASAT